MKPAFRVALKLAAVAALLAYALSSAEVAEVLARLRGVSVAALAAAFLCLAVSQLVSAGRMRHYVRAASERILAWPYAAALYFLGMFYNNFLPGGIGGDGYRLLAFRRQGMGAASALRVLLSERANGLYVLCLLFALIGAATVREVSPWLWAAFAGCVTAGYAGCARLLLRERPRVTLGALPWSLAVQLTTLGAASAILHSLGAGERMGEYLCVFLVASVLAAVFPFSIGGVGIREVTFLEAARLLPVDGDLGIAFSLAYFGVYLLCSLTGAIFVFRLPAARV